MNPKNEPTSKCERVLVVAESDTGGAGGVQGDTKTILALGGFATSAITALSIQDENNVDFIKFVSAPLVARQMRAALNRGGADAIKIGYIRNEETINAVADILDESRNKNIPVVVDPSIVARNGESLVDEKALAAWKRRLYLHAKILTPNLREAELLGAMRIKDIDDMRAAAEMMRTIGVENVVLKGGQDAAGNELYFVATPEEERIYQRATLDTPHTLGAGSAFSAALAVSLARKMPAFEAVEHALDFVHQAIVHSLGFGDDAGSINHAFDIQTRPSVFHPEEIKIYKR